MNGLDTLLERLPPLPQRMLAGVSGGADSVALLRLLLAAGCSVQAVHVNHGLRGAASDEDEAFVRQLCEVCQVPLMVYRATPPEHPGEDWARRVRYDFFRQAMEHTGAEALALAHHQDDQAETLLLHLMRGAGLTGLTAMSADSSVQGMRIIRPLLYCTRRELQEALIEAHQPWREDASNQDPRYLRNAVRLELLPLMERLAPGASARIAGAALLMQDDENMLNLQCEAFLQQWGDDALPLEALGKEHPAMQRRILRRWWQHRAGEQDERSLSRRQTEALTALLAAKPGSRCNLPLGWQAYRGWTHLHIIDTNENTVQAARLQGEIPEGCEVRTRQTGDWLRLPGGRKSLQDFMVDRKIDAPFRDRVSLVCRGQQVLAAAGIWQDQSMKPLNWTGPMPWVVRQDPRIK